MKSESCILNAYEIQNFIQNDEMLPLLVVCFRSHHWWSLMVRAICVPSSVFFDGSASPFSTGGPKVSKSARFRPVASSGIGGLQCVNHPMSHEILCQHVPMGVIKILIMM
jgi:hypothetical protein